MRGIRGEKKLKKNLAIIREKKKERTRTIKFGALFEKKGSGSGECGEGGVARPAAPDTGKIKRRRGGGIERRSRKWTMKTKETKGESVDLCEICWKKRRITEKQNNLVPYLWNGQPKNPRPAQDAMKIGGIALSRERTREKRGTKLEIHCRKVGESQEGVESVSTARCNHSSPKEL